MVKSYPAAVGFFHRLHAPERQPVPDALMAVVEKNLREQLDEADGESRLRVPGDQERNQDCVHRAGRAPRQGFHKTSIRFLGHNYFALF